MRVSLSRVVLFISLSGAWYSISSLASELKIPKGPENGFYKVGESIKLSCEVETEDNIIIDWEKYEGAWLPVMLDNRTSQLEDGSLHLKNIDGNDEGFYRCTVTNNLDLVNSEKGFVEVEDKTSRSIGEGHRRVTDFVHICLDEARVSVRRGIKKTIRVYKPDSSYYLTAARYPRKRYRGVAQAGANYHSALDLMASECKKSDLTMKEISTSHMMSTVDRETGCAEARHAVSCEDSCHSKYRTIDGTCNNLEHVLWGSANNLFSRMAPAHFASSYGAPVGSDPKQLFNGFIMPDPREVSRTCLMTSKVEDDSKMTQLLMTFGQFIDHDITLALPSSSKAAYTTGELCSEVSYYAEPCFALKIKDDELDHKGKHFISFVRDAGACTTTSGSAFQADVAEGSIRENVNLITAYIDASQVYSPHGGSAERLWDHNTGLMIMGPAIVKDSKATGANMPPTDIPGEHGSCIKRRSSKNCYITGDERGNENPELLCMHTTFLREHNRVATILRRLNPGWKPYNVYQETRRYIGAILQKFTMQWLQNLIGLTEYNRLVGNYNAYDETIDASLPNELATAALRCGHGLVHTKVKLPKTLKENNPESKEFVDTTFETGLPTTRGCDTLIMGLTSAAGKKPGPEGAVQQQLIDELFGIGDHPPIDLPAMNIQRGRDHGLASYLELRKLCGLTPIDSWADLSNLMPADKVHKLRSLYGTPKNIDLFVGGMLENLVPDGKVGPTFACILGESFKKLRDGDRFWYENKFGAGAFTDAQLASIQTATLSNTFCKTAETMQSIPLDVFDPLSPTMDCSAMDVDFSPWIDPGASAERLQISCMGNSPPDEELLPGDYLLGRQIHLYVDSQYVPVTPNHGIPGEGIAHIPSDARDIAISCYAGVNDNKIKVTTSVDTAEPFADTVFSTTTSPLGQWVCSNQCSEGWFKPEYDDSNWETPARDSDFISLDGEAGTLYCRFTKRPINDDVTFYVAGTNVDIQVNTEVINCISTNIVDGDTIAITGDQQPTFVAFLADSKSAGTAGEILIGSKFGFSSNADFRWRCRASADGDLMDGWNTVNYVEGEDWFSPATVTKTSTLPVDTIGERAIWAQDSDSSTAYQYAYCRVFLTSSALSRADTDAEQCRWNLRSASVCDVKDVSGMSTREPVNTATAALDGSSTYSTEPLRLADIRQFTTGLLKVEKTSCGDNIPTESGRFMTGGTDALHPYILAVDTLFHREHNRIATELRSLSKLNDEDLFQLARKIVSAELQVLTYNELLPELLGYTPDYVQSRTTFRAHTVPDIFVEVGYLMEFIMFAMTGEEIITANNNPADGIYESFSLASYYSDDKMFKFICAMDFLISGSLRSSPLKRNTKVASVFHRNRGAADRLGTMDIFAKALSVGRELGLPGYNQMKTFCGLQFDDMDLQRFASSRYKSTDDIDLLFGLMYEKGADSGRAMLGETGACLLEMQFQAIMEGDRHFFTHVHQQGGNLDQWKPAFDEAQRQHLLARSMRDLICDNTDLVNVQRNPFQASNAESGNDKSDNKSDNDFIECDEEVTKLDLKLFLDPSNLRHTSSKEGHSKPFKPKPSHFHPKPSGPRPKPFVHRPKPSGYRKPVFKPPRLVRPGPKRPSRPPRRPKPAYNPYSTRYDQKKYDIPYRMRHFRRSQLTEGEEDENNETESDQGDLEQFGFIHDFDLENSVESEADQDSVNPLDFDL